MPDCPECKSYVQVGNRRCPNCGYETDFDRLAAQQREERQRALGIGLDEATLSERAEAQAEQQRRLAAVTMTTLSTVPGREIHAAVTVVSAEVGPLTYATAGLFGPAEGAFDANWSAAKQEALASLRAQAVAAECDAIVGLDMRLAAVSGSQTSYAAVMMVMLGTAVRLANRPGPGDNTHNASQPKREPEPTPPPAVPRW